MPPPDPRWGDVYDAFAGVDPQASAKGWQEKLANVSRGGGNAFYNREADANLRAANLGAAQTRANFMARGGRGLGRAGTLLAGGVAEPGLAQAQANASGIRTQGLDFERGLVNDQAAIDARGIDQLLAAITGRGNILRDEASSAREWYDAETRRGAASRNQYLDLLDAVRQAGFITMPDGSRLSSSQLLRLLQGANVGDSFQIKYPNDEDEG